MGLPKMSWRRSWRRLIRIRGGEIGVSEVMPDAALSPYPADPKVNPNVFVSGLLPVATYGWIVDQIYGALK